MSDYLKSEEASLFGSLDLPLPKRLAFAEALAQAGFAQAGRQTQASPSMSSPSGGETLFRAKVI